MQSVIPKLQQTVRGFVQHCDVITTNLQKGLREMDKIRHSWTNSCDSHSESQAEQLSRRDKLNCNESRQRPSGSVLSETAQIHTRTVRVVKQTRTFTSYNIFVLKQEVKAGLLVDNQ